MRVDGLRARHLAERVVECRRRGSQLAKTTKIPGLGGGAGGREMGDGGEEFYFRANAISFPVDVRTKNGDCLFRRR